MEKEEKRYRESIENGYCMYPLCNRSFFECDSPRSHMIADHLYYYCNFCDRSFYLEKALNDHMNSTGHGCTCNVCNKMFYTKKDLNKHKREHRNNGRNGFHRSSSAYLSLPVDDSPVTLNCDLPNVLKGMKGDEPLADFITRVIRPQHEYHARCEDMVNRLKKFLENNTKLHVKRVVVAGSVGKLTNVPAYSDVDLVVFIDNYPTMAQFRENLDSVLKDLERHVLNDFNWAQKVVHVRTTHHAVQFKATLKGYEKTILRNIDLLPAFDLSDKDFEEIYEEMSEKTDKEQSYYSVSFAEYQTDFVKSKLLEVRDLIRLLKYWKMTEDVPVRSYFLELLVIYMWQNEWQNQEFLVCSYFREVISELTNIANMRIIWPDIYTASEYTTIPENPVLLDPVNPYSNVAPSADDVDKIVAKSRNLLNRIHKMSEFKDKRNTFVRPSQVNIDMLDDDWYLAHNDESCCVII